jgi:phage-related protein (TIGR01555 family)
MPKAKKKKAKAKKKQSSKPVRKHDSDGRYSRRDGWENSLSGKGGTKDPRTATRFGAGRIIKDTELSSLYRFNGVAKRIVNLPADDTTRNWFTITNDDEKEVSQKLEELKAQGRLNHALKMSRLYGGAIVIMGVNDGGKLEDPVNEDRIKSVDYLTVFERRDVTIQPTDIENDIDSGNFGEPSLYEVMPRFGSTPFKVHASRVLRFDGAELGWEEYESNGYWHDSVIQAAYEAVRQLGAVYDNSEFITEDFIQTVIKIKNIMQHMARDNGATLKERLELLALSRSIANAAIIDTEEEYEKHSSTVSGLEVLLDRFMMALSAATGIPVTLLMGRSPAGENATGEADVRFYYDTIRSSQRNDFRPKVEKLIEYIWASEGLTEPETWAIEFRPLQEPSAKEESALYKETAEADALYITHQVLDPLVIGKYRFAGDRFNATPPSIDKEEFEEEEVPPPSGSAGAGSPIIPPIQAGAVPNPNDEEIEEEGDDETGSQDDDEE